MTAERRDYWRRWVKAAAIRAVKTVAQSAAAVIATATAMGEVDWAAVAGTALLAGVLSVLTSLSGLPEVEGVAEVELFEEDDVVDHVQ